MNVYPDASVVVAVVLQEPGWREIAAAAGSAEAVHLSDFCYGEVVSSIGIAARRHRIETSMAGVLIADLRDFSAHWNRMAVEAGDIARATDLVAMIHLGLRLPDAIHIAAAERLGATLVTTDRQQHHAALSLGVGSFNPLESSTL